MNTILCAIDFSKSAGFAIKYAAEICEKMAAKLHVIHIYNYSTLAKNIEEDTLLSDQEILENKNNELKKFCKKHLKHNKKVDYTFSAFEGLNVVDEINATTKIYHAFLIVVGMKGLHQFKNFFIGNTTKKLIEKAAIPVLAVPNLYIDYTFKTIVYATDFMKEDIFAIQQLNNFAVKLKSTIKVVHIAKPVNNKAKDEMEWFKELIRQKIPHHQIEFYLLYSDDILNTLHEFIEQHQANIIAMLKRKKITIFPTFLERDLVKKFETYINIPLLSFRERNYN